MSLRKAIRTPGDIRVSGWYALLPEPPPPRTLEGKHKADWVVIGAGFAGLAAARRLSQLLPGEHLALYNACVVEKDFEKGRKIMSALLPLMRVLEQGGKFVQSIKFGCELAGLPAGPVRKPMQGLDEDQKRELEEVIRTLKSVIASIEGKAGVEGRGKSRHAHGKQAALKTA